MYGLLPSFQPLIISASRKLVPSNPFSRLRVLTVLLWTWRIIGKTMNASLQTSHLTRDHEREGGALLVSRLTRTFSRVVELFLHAMSAGIGAQSAMGKSRHVHFVRYVPSARLCRLFFQGTDYHNRPSRQNASIVRFRRHPRPSEWTQFSNCPDPTYPAIRLESEIVVMNQRLGNIEHLLSAQVRQPDATRQIHPHLSPDTVHASSPRVPTSVATDRQTPSAPEAPAFPTMVIRNKLFTRLVGLDDDLAVRLTRLERSGDRKHQHAIGRHFFLQQHTVSK